MARQTVRYRTPAPEDLTFSLMHIFVTFLATLITESIIYTIEISQQMDVSVLGGLEDSLLWEPVQQFAQPVNSIEVTHF